MWCGTKRGACLKQAVKSLGIQFRIIITIIPNICWLAVIHKQPLPLTTSLHKPYPFNQNENEFETSTEDTKKNNIITFSFYARFGHTNWKYYTQFSVFECICVLCAHQLNPLHRPRLIFTMCNYFLSPVLWYVCTMHMISSEYSTKFVSFLLPFNPTISLLWPRFLHIVSITPPPHFLLFASFYKSHFHLFLKIPLPVASSPATFPLSLLLFFPLQPFHLPHCAPYLDIVSERCF